MNFDTSVSVRITVSVFESWVSKIERDKDEVDFIDTYNLLKSLVSSSR